jgi:Tfp pilus assembly protein PilO
MHGERIMIKSQSCVHKKLKRNCIQGMLPRNSVQKLLSSNLLSKITKIKMHSCIILFVVVVVVVWGQRTWSLTLMKENMLRMSENTVLRETLGPKENKVTKEWMRLQNKEFRDRYE